MMLDNGMNATLAQVTAFTMNKMCASTRQECRPLLKKKVKKRPTGFALTTTRNTNPTHTTSAGRTRREQTASSNNEVPDCTGSQDMAVPGLTGTPLAEPGSTGHLFRRRQVLPAKRLAAFSAPGNVRRTKRSGKQPDTFGTLQ
eukprot:6481163-Amphidinium_carterae.1